MNKHVAILLVTCSTCLFSFAQYQKGDSKFNLSLTGSSIRFPSAQVGYERFLSDKLSIGADGSFSHRSMSGFGTASRMKISPFAKYYFKNYGVLRPFAYVNGTVSKYSFSPGPLNDNGGFTRAQFGASTGMGVSIHVSERLAFETSLGYGVTSDQGRFYSGLRGNFGISYTLPHRSRRKK